MVRSPGTMDQHRMEKHWEQYIDTGTLDLGQVNNVIAASWGRCRSASVNPIGGMCSRVHNDDYLQDLRESNRKLLNIATPMVESIYHSIQGSGFMVVLVNKEGIVLKTMGDRETLGNAEKLNFYSGANWTEESVGTNAIGTCLAAGIPIQVTGAEHFCSNHHAWTCSAAPIGSPGGRVLGCLDISGPYDRMHTHTLAIVMAAARALENQLCKELTSKELSSALSYYKAVVNSIPDGFLSVNDEGIITDVNTPACRILGLPLKRLKGQRADHVLRSTGGLKDILTSGQGRHSEKFFIDTPRGRLRCEAYARA
ncbi:MAG: sigma-54-dependent Fis family transcriptional regulator, partial [Desulfocucumaceae bacterium]